MSVHSEKKSGLDELRIWSTWKSGYLEAVLDQQTVINVNMLLGKRAMQRQMFKEDNLQIITWF